MKKKTVIILATGGTIAGVQDKGNKLGYYSGEMPIEEMVSLIKDINEIANLELYQICNMQSDNITQKEWLKLAQFINTEGKRKDVAGFVITHGTNVIEETAYFLNLVVKVKKPVVLTGAMRPATDDSPDGPHNLKQALYVAISEEAAERNVMVVFDGCIYGARDVRKQSTLSCTAFGQGDLGCQGYIWGEKPVFYQMSSRCNTVETEFDVANVIKLPKVAIIYFYVDADEALLEYVYNNMNGVVIAGTGNCGLSDIYIRKIAEYSEKGKVTVISSRVENGPVYGGFANFPTVSEKIICSDTLTPQKARILLQLALLKTGDINTIQKMFNKY